MEELLGYEVQILCAQYWIFCRNEEILSLAFVGLICFNETITADDLKYTFVEEPRPHLGLGQKGVLIDGKSRFIEMNRLFLWRRCFNHI